MKKIILASASKQRKKLLKLTRIPFVISPSRIHEINKITTSASSLVQLNAKLKAEDIASKYKDGLIIGADTIVYSRRSGIITKPKNLKHAKKILRTLTESAHWVYTGLVVLDAKTHKMMSDYEKTKIYMHKISDAEIERYHKITPPLDKAGGFDIEGRGGLFINRIEGCYSNVIGLPLAKLRMMLRKFGVPLLSVLLCASLTGCSTEFNLATNQQETLMYGTEKEIKIGDAVSAQLEKKMTISTNVEYNHRVQDILDRIVAVCDRKELVYIIRVIDEDDLNAVSLPGGYIYIFRGLIESLDNDDELAGVIAHEVGHITAKHGIKRLQSLYGYTLLKVLSVASGSNELARGTSAIYASVFLAHSRQDEFMADKLAVKYTRDAGYNPKAMIKALEAIKKDKDKKLRRITYFRTHPHLIERMSVVNSESTGKMNFKDYLNLTGAEDEY